MPLDENQLGSQDRNRLEHMLEAASDLVNFKNSKTREDLDTDALLRRGVLHCTIVIGEASARVSPEARSLLPTLPWGQIVATRHILVHVYWGVDLDIIWQVARLRAPEIVEVISDLLRRYPKASFPDFD